MTEPVSTAATQPAAVEMLGITKRFGDLVALDEVDFDVRPGEVHALVGENGAGKSTLMNCLFGLVPPDAGEIRLRGAHVAIDGPRAAIRAGIGMVHQHFKLVPSLTVAQNVFLGHELARGGVVHQDEQRQRVAQLASRYTLEVDPGRRVERLTVGQRQRVEILRALSEDVRTLILDEPTALLTPKEVDGLFVVLRELVTDGLSVVFVTHRLREVRAVSDRLSVLRDGRRVATERAADVDERQIARLMVGREVLFRISRDDVPAGDERLRVQDLAVFDDRGHEVVHGVSFSVRSGEILGIAAVTGNGQSELIEAITGIRRPAGGRVTVVGADLTGRRASAFRVAGVAHIPEDRQVRGVSGWSSVADNVFAGYLDDRSLGGRLVDHGRVRALAKRLIERFAVTGASPDTLARRLSGGNMQKVVLARELSRNPKVIVAAEPTRGLDVAAIESVQRTLVEHRRAGAAIVLTSTELSELRALSDRLLVIHAGRIVAEFAGDIPAEREIGPLMLGLAAA